MHKNEVVYQNDTYKSKPGGGTVNAWFASLFRDFVQKCLVQYCEVIDSEWEDKYIQTLGESSPVIAIGAISSVYR